jgi:hypothetical protein
MIKRALFFSSALLSLIACNSVDRHEDRVKKHYGASDGPFSRFIPVDSANKMITSYLNSISNTDSSLKSLVIDMDQLRRYTDSLEGGKRITHLKLCFAHTLEYINAGHANQNAAYLSGGLTLVIAGFDSSGHYVYFDGNTVLEYCAPCPYSCPSGDAGNSLLTD